MVLQHDLCPVDARHAAHRLVGVRHHQKGEVGRAEVRGQPQPDVRDPLRGHGARRHEAERGHRLVQLGVAHRVQGVQHLASRRSHLGPGSPSSTSVRRPSGRRPAVGRQLELCGNLDAVELRGVQAEDLLLGRCRDPWVVGELLVSGSPSRRSPRSATWAPRCRSRCRRSSCPRRPRTAARPSPSRRTSAARASGRR